MSHSLDFTAREAGPAPPPTVSGRVTYFTHTLCPYAERVWIALLEKEVPFDLVHIDLSSKPSWFRSINPAGLVPAVRHNAHTVTESLGIIAWVDSEFEGPNLAGNNPKELKEAIYAGSSVASAGLDLLSGKNGRYWGISGGQSTGQKQAMEKALQALFEHQTHPGPFLLGDCISLADIAVYPFIQRFAVITPELCGYQFETACNGKVHQMLLLIFNTFIISALS